ncbi:MAG: hypothetical protein QXY42_03900 [Candidatus Bathyarchaeia archaeon]
MARRGLGAEDLMRMAAFSCLYGLARAMPIFPIIGIQGGSFSAADALAPALGLAFGPLRAAIAILIGTFLGISLTGRTIFFGLDFLPATSCAALIGLVAKGRRSIGLSLLLALTIAFALSPYSLPFISIAPLGFGIPWFWLHLIALALLASPAAKLLAAWATEGLTHKRLLGAGALALCGTLAQHLTGCLLFELFYGLLLGVPPESFKRIWAPIFWIYPAERALIAAGSALAIAAVSSALRAFGKAQAH